jgi:MFS family permease
MLSIVGGILAVFAPNYWIFTLVRLCVGISVGGTMVTAFVIVMEFIGSKYRDVISAIFHVPFNLGNLMLPGFGYLFRNYRDFQLAISLPSIVLLSYFCLLPESPRWLIAVKKTDEAVEILKKMAKT